MMNKEIERIKEFDFLRVFAMMMIFFIHTRMYYPVHRIPDLGARGVEIFILLSGFLLAYNHFEDSFDNTIKSNIFFAFSHIKKMYTLHIATLLLSIILNCIDFGISWILSNKVVILLNVFLLQSFVPKEEIYFGCNGVSWFLSSIFFCYFCYPTILNFLKKQKQEAYTFFLLISIILYITFQSLFTGIGFFTVGYVFHVFPVSKLYEMFLGCLVGLIYKTAKNKYKFNFYILMGCLLFTSFCIAKCNSCFSRAEFIAIFCLLIFVFANFKDDSVVAQRLLNNKIINFFSSISFEFFMIHQICIRCYLHVGDFIKSNYGLIFPWEVNVFLIFASSTLFSFLWKRGYVSFCRKLIQYNL